MWCHSVVKLHEASQMLVMADCVRGMNMKSPVCRANNYRSFEHLLFFVFCFFVCFCKEGSNTYVNKTSSISCLKVLIDHWPDSL